MACSSVGSVIAGCCSVLEAVSRTLISFLTMWRQTATEDTTA